MSDEKNQTPAEGMETSADETPNPEQAAAEASADELIEEVTAEVLQKAQDEAREWQDKFMRLHAEWDTYRRRMAQAREEEKVRAAEGLVEALLPVIDDFERSIDYASQNGEAGLLEGITQVHNKLVGVLEKNGVEVINPVGEAFDALSAQAVAKVEDPNVYDETVKDVYQKGYRMGTKVIRSAMVTVTSGGPARPAPEAEADKES